jgi:hypothetical protein
MHVTLPYIVHSTRHLNTKFVHEVSKILQTITNDIHPNKCILLYSFVGYLTSHLVTTAYIVYRRMDGWLITRKYFDSNGRGLRHCIGIRQPGLRRSTGHLNQDSLCPCRNSEHLPKNSVLACSAQLELCTLTYEIRHVLCAGYTMTKMKCRAERITNTPYLKDKMAEASGHTYLVRVGRNIQSIQHNSIIVGGIKKLLSYEQVYTYNVNTWDYGLLGCDSLYFGKQAPPFLRNRLPPSSGYIPLYTASHPTTFTAMSEEWMGKQNNFLDITFGVESC